MLSVQKCPDKIFHVKSRRGKIVRIVREHYVRDDIYCQSKACKVCKHTNPVLPTSADTNHYLVVDLETLVTFLELFEQPEFNNIIVPQTILTEIQERGSLKVLGRIRDVVNDARRNSIIFINENFSSTFTERSHQSLEERNQTAVIKVAAWYQSHLDPKSNIHVVFVSENEAVLQRATKEAKVKTQRLGQYVQNYLPKYPDLFELYESLATLAEQDEDADGSAPTGYEEYKPDDVLDSGVKSSVFYRGKIQVGRHGSDEAWVRIDERAALGKDILIPDKICRNRAFHGDVVAVELLDPRFWVKSDDGQASDQPCGKVVGVLQRNWRSYVCTIQEEDVQNAKGDKMEWVVAVPWDHRIPKIRIKTRQTKEIGNCRIVVRVDRWDADSNYPQGHYVRTLGEIGKLETEMQVLMQENGIQHAPFSQHMLSELPEHTPEKPWTPSPEEIAKRRDCRSWRVFSIDPLGSQDIDDALSVNVLPNGNYELGCHIADVTAFVAEGSLLDAEAQARSTSVYLSDRRIDMLPALLSERLCSIRERQDRYAMSCIWTFDKDANVLDTWYGRTVINSKYEFHYQQAQDIIDDSSAEQRKKLGKEYDAVRKDMLIMRDLFRILRDRRLAKGALELESVEIKFNLDQDKKIVGLKTKQELEVNAMIAEYMILANCYVAKFIYQHFPESALLRRHPLPRNDSFQEMIRLAQLKGFKIDTSSNKALAQSLSKAVLAGDDTFNRLLRSLATLAMAEAEYFSTGSFEKHDFYHYGLAAEYYTHFTSPIRRYADVLVHRQLMAALEGTQPSLNNSALQSVAEHINEKHRQSKQVQRDSTDLFEVLYFREHPDVVEDSVVFSFRKNGFLVYIPKFGLKSPVFLRDNDGKSLIPLDANGADGVADFEILQDSNRMVVKTSRGGNNFIDALDHVSVRIRVQESRAHLPPLRFELVKFGAKSGAPLAVLDGKTVVNLKQAVLQDQKESVEQEAEAQRRKLIVPEYLQTEESQSFYALADKFASLSLDDDKSKLSSKAALQAEIESSLKASKAPPFLRQTRGKRTFQSEKLQVALAQAGLLRHHDALKLTGGLDDEDYDEEYYDEEAPYEPVGSTKLSDVVGSQKAAGSSSSAKQPPAAAASSSTAPEAAPKKAFTPFKAKGFSASAGSSSSSSTSSAAAAAEAAPKKAFTPFKARGFPSDASSSSSSSSQQTFAGGHATREQAIARGDAVSTDKLADKAIGDKYKDTIKKAEQDLKAKNFQAFKAKKRY